MEKIKSTASNLLFFLMLVSFQNALATPPSEKNWRLVFEENFSDTNAALDKNWDFQNCPNSHILCSRWRENATVENGILKLNNKKETRAGQDWTSASMWTKRKFLYGYFECRYKYAPTSGVNNSFWLITTGGAPKGQKHFEIDINEGHYPNEVNTNLHNWSDFFTTADGKKSHHSYHEMFNIGGALSAPWSSFESERGVRTSKIRVLRSSSYPYFHIRAIRAFGKSAEGYPDPKFWSLAQSQNLADYAQGATVRASGCFGEDAKYAPQNAVDGREQTSWISNKAGEKWLEVDFGQLCDINCIQLLTGWYKGEGSARKWYAWAADLQVQYWNSAREEWLSFPSTSGIHYAFKAVESKKFRFKTSSKPRFSIAEIALYNAADTGGSRGDSGVSAAGSCGNLAREASVKSGDGAESTGNSHVTDGNQATVWKPSASLAENWVELNFDAPKKVDCVRIDFGKGDKFIPSNYVVEYYEESENVWKNFAVQTSKYPDTKNALSNEYHTYGLEWNKDELVFYFDGKVLRRMKNEICHSSAPVYLSAAIASFAGEVTNAIDGTSMDVDWVRVYELDSPDKKQ